MLLLINKQCLISAAMALMLLITLWSCTTKPVNRYEDLLIAETVLFRLLPSTVFDQSHSVTQKVTIRYQEKQNSFIARMEVSPEGLVVVALSELGQTIFTMQYLNNELNIKKAFLVPQMPDLKYLLADIQLIYWPVETLKQQLARSSVQVLESRVAKQSWFRSIQKDGRELIVIQYEKEAGFDNHVILTHRERGYKIEAEVLSFE